MNLQLLGESIISTIQSHSTFRKKSFRLDGQAIRWYTAVKIQVIFSSVYIIKSQILPQKRQEWLRSQVRDGLNPYAGEKLIVMFPILNLVLLQQTC
jgi:hypothetical protein